MSYFHVSNENFSQVNEDDVRKLELSWIQSFAPTVSFMNDFFYTVTIFNVLNFSSANQTIFYLTTFNYVNSYVESFVSLIHYVKAPIVFFYFCGSSPIASKWIICSPF